MISSTYKQRKNPDPTSHLDIFPIVSIFLLYHTPSAHIHLIRNISAFFTRNHPVTHCWYLPFPSQRCARQDRTPCCRPPRWRAGCFGHIPSQRLQFFLGNRRSSCVGFPIHKCVNTRKQLTIHIIIFCSCFQARYV